MKLIARGVPILPVGVEQLVNIVQNAAVSDPTKFVGHVQRKLVVVLQPAP
jgi:hypothetical protein